MCFVVGDSGGPLLLLHTRSDDPMLGEPDCDQLVGIVSLGNDCCEEAIEGVAYTQVNRFNHWIFEMLGRIDPRLRVRMSFQNCVLNECHIVFAIFATKAKRC